MKRKVIINCIATMLLVCSGFLLEIHAEETISEKSQLTVPWDEFKKLLHLDEDEIVLPLETFQKLLAQTGIKTTPTHTVKEGNVVLTRVEFKKLVDQMKPPTGPDIQPPFDYLITKATYSGIMKENTTLFTGTFTVHVLKKDVYLKIPLLPQSIALEEVTVGDKQAQVVTENGYHNVVLSQSGEYVVIASFSLKSSLEKGPHRIDLTIQQTPITLLKLTLPLKNIDVEIPQAQQLLTDVKDDTSIVSAIIAPSRTISIRWRKKVTVAEKIPPKLYSETYHLISIEDDVLKINSDINYTILHSEVDNVRLSISEDINVLNISGEGVGEWQEELQEDQRLILIPFTYSKKGAVTVTVTAEKPLSDKGVTNGFSGIRVLNTVRETGSIGIELNTSAEVLVAESEGLEKVAAEKLPRILYNKSVKPLILGFKYLKHPYSLVLDVHKHEKISVPVATINSASVVTLFTEDGKVVHRLVYQVRNSSKQFLEMQLPDKADVWSVFVANEPVESSINSQDKLLVPLIRSRSVNNRLDTFPVEIIYCLAEERFSPVGMQISRLPAVDLLISQLIWSVYLPNDYAYIYFKSTLEKEEMIRGLNVLSGPLRQYDEVAMKEASQFADERSQEIKSDQLKKAYKGKDHMSSFRNLPLNEEQLSSQVHAELEFGGRLEGLAQQGEVGAAVARNTAGTGILPIQIEIPTGGQVYRFAKTIIKAEDPLTVSVIFTQYWLIALLKWLFIVFILWVIYLKRKAATRLFQQSKDTLGSLITTLNKYDAPIKQRAQSKITPFVLVGLFIVFLFISRLLALLIFFLLWISVIYQVFLYREKKAQTTQKKTEEHGQSNGSF